MVHNKNIEYLRCGASLHSLKTFADTIKNHPTLKKLIINESQFHEIEVLTQITKYFEEISNSDLKVHILIHKSIANKDTLIKSKFIGNVVSGSAKLNTDPI